MFYTHIKQNKLDELILINEIKYFNYLPQQRFKKFSQLAFLMLNIIYNPSLRSGLDTRASHSCLNKYTAADAMVYLNTPGVQRGVNYI